MSDERKKVNREYKDRLYEHQSTYSPNLAALLAECLERDGRLQDLKLLSDAKVRGRLFREYHIIKD